MRVVIYARYSTDEQDESSIDDQIAYCKKRLTKMGLTDVEFTILDDKETSGELRNRPGVNQIWEGIQLPRWNLLVAEDVGRLFCNQSACLELIETAVDNGMRVICFNDDIDTNEEGWKDGLADAAQHHAKANYYTRKRLQRKIEGLWKQGAAVVGVMPGYGRKYSVPATERERARGPSFDFLHPQWAPVVAEAFERIANGDPPRSVARWLTHLGLPKFKSGHGTEWTVKCVLRLIRHKIYRGVEEFRRKIVTKKLRTGRTKDGLER